MGFEGLPQATFIFIAANVILSIYAFTNERFFVWGRLHVGSILGKQEWHRVLTSGFLHVDPGHLLINMLTLFFFGPVMERVLTPRGFFIAYLGALIIGSLAAIFRHAKEPHYSAVGASGAVSGILFAYCLVAPFNMIYIFGILPVPALLFAVLFTAYSVYGMQAKRDNIGHDAHLFGGIAGVVIAILIRPDLVPHFVSKVTGLLG